MCDEVAEKANGIVIRPQAELVDGWDDLAPHLPDADLARGVRDERDMRAEAL